ncbi:hypothetical protein RB195_002421 [Necator americanus]
MNWIILLTTLISLNLFASLVAILLLTAHLFAYHNPRKLGDSPTAAALTTRTNQGNNPCASGQLRTLLGISCAAALDMAIYEDNTMMLTPRDGRRTATTLAPTSTPEIVPFLEPTNSPERSKFSRGLFTIIATCSSVRDLLDERECKDKKEKIGCGDALEIAMQCPYTCFCSS